MDPLSAVSLAGTVVQFVDYATKLLLASGELYQKYELKSHTLAAESALAVQRLATSAVRDLQDYRFKLQNVGSVVHDELATDEAALQDLSRKCNEDAAVLIARLEKLKIPENTNHRGWLSLSQALASIWAQRDIDKMSQKLLEYKTHINGQVLHSLGKRLNILSIQQSQSFRTMTYENQQMISALANIQNSLTEDFQEQMTALGQLIDRATVVVSEHTDQDDRTRKVILDVFQAAAFSSHEREGLLSVKDKEQAIRKKVGQDLLNSLWFPSITERFEEVAEAHRKTYQWIFKSPDETVDTGRDKRWDNFPQWLRRDTGLYWMNGKAASGKSMLMKYIFMHPETNKHLKGWALMDSQSPYPLYSAGFFFWLSGTKEQKSQSGLLRSLLYDILQQNRNLIPVLFPKQWSIRYSAEILSSGSGGNPLNSVWLLSSLKTAFKILITQDQIPLKLCLFIDGLDEYEGDETEIAALFGEVSRSANVKCCVSSRPHIPFQDAFSGQPGLRLEDLTFFDIKHYVKDELADDFRMRKLSSDEPQEAARLIDEIVTSANGVFLWVKLVVTSLLKGLGNHDQITDLQARLRVIPEKLEDLYMHMIRRVDESYQKEASRLYQLIGAAVQGREDDWKLVSPLSLFSIALAEHSDPNFALTAKVPFLKFDDMVPLCKKIANRITSRCGGLLEIQGRPRHHISPQMKVSYLHRTVKDCLEKWENQAILKDWTGNSSGTESYSPNLAILKSYILQLKCIRDGNRHNVMEYRQCIDGAILYARRVEVDTCSANLELMDEFFRIAFYWIKKNVSSEKVFRPGASVLTIAVQCGLPQYLRAKLAEQPQPVTPSELSVGKKLLGYALAPVHGLERFVNADVVSALLDFGIADPNETLRMTINYLGTSSASNQLEPSSGYEVQLKTWANLIEKLLCKDVRLTAVDTAFLRRKFSSVLKLEQQIDAALRARAEKTRAQNVREKHKCRQQ